MQEGLRGLCDAYGQAATPQRLGDVCGLEIRQQFEQSLASVKRLANGPPTGPTVAEPKKSVAEQPPEPVQNAAELNQPLLPGPLRTEASPPANASPIRSTAPVFGADPISDPSAFVNKANSEGLLDGLGGSRLSRAPNLVFRHLNTRLQALGKEIAAIAVSRGNGPAALGGEVKI